MRRYITESELRQIIRDVISECRGANDRRPASLRESRSVKSRRLQSIMSAHGGLMGRGSGNSVYDIHNISDSDILCVIPFDEYRSLYNSKYSVDHGRWADNYSLEVWARQQGVSLEPGDRIGVLKLKDDNVVLFINRNESCVPTREGGWKSCHEKRTKREKDRSRDGANYYIPLHRRPFEHGQIWKNPYRRDWGKEVVDAKMDAIRRYNDGADRPLNY